MSADPNAPSAAEADDLELDDDLMAAIAAAEAAVGEMVNDYPDLLAQDVALLKTAVRGLRETSLGTDDHTKACVDAFGVLHDIKGQAASFGFEAATFLCDPLCECVRGKSGASNDVIHLIEAAIVVLDRMVTEGATPELNDAAYALAKQVPHTT